MRTRRARPATAALVVLAGVAAASPAPAHATAPHPPARCSALHGRDLLPGTPAAKLVAVPYTGVDDGDRYPRLRYIACAGTRGHVHRVADVGGSLGYQDSVGVGPAAGTSVLLKVGGGNTLGDYYQADWRVVDAATGRSYRLWSFRTGSTKNALPSPAEVVLDAGGRAAAVFAPGGYEEGFLEHPFVGLPAGATTLVGVFAASGRRTTVDSGGAEIAPSSLALSGTVASWTHGTDRRSADLGPLPSSAVKPCSSTGLRAERTDGPTTSSVAVANVEVAGATCGAARTLAAAAARRELAGTLATSVRGWTVVVSRPCPGCSPVLPVVATRGPSVARFELRGGA